MHSISVLCTQSSLVFSWSPFSVLGSCSGFLITFNSFIFLGSSWLWLFLKLCLFFDDLDSVEYWSGVSQIDPQMGFVECFSSWLRLGWCFRERKEGEVCSCHFVSGCTLWTGLSPDDVGLITWLRLCLSGLPTVKWFLSLLCSSVPSPRFRSRSMFHLLRVG